MTETAEPMADQVDQQKLAEELVEAARADCGPLAGEDGLLTGLTKLVLETARDAEMIGHVGYDEHEPASHNGGTWATTVMTDVGHADDRGTARQ